MSDTTLKTVPLDALHRELGARMVPFAGYAMPVQYTGILAEHQACREGCALFDVSHMGQCLLTARSGDESDVPAALETLTPGSLKELKHGRQRYTLLLDDDGGILDDLMIAHMGGGKWFAVVNAACKDADFALLERALGDRLDVQVLHDRALIAVQGPKAAKVMAHLAPASESMVFMDFGPLEVGGVPCWASRSGYTGEDGFEISVPAAHVEHLARAFLDLDGVTPAGLGARDSLRLEAGLPLYGSDIDTTTTPVEGALEFAIGKRRRRDGGFPGAERILAQLADGAPRRRVGIRLDGRAPARAHAEIQDMTGRRIGEVTSGGFGPTVGGPVAMGLIETACAEVGTKLNLIVRGKPLEGTVVDLPFVDQRYHRG